jgi:hypothetical protein
MFIGAEHWNFTDANLISPVLFRTFGLAGEIDPTFMMNSINAIVSDFFNSVFQDKAFDPTPYLSDPRIKPSRF